MRDTGAGGGFNQQIVLLALEISSYTCTDEEHKHSPSRV